MITAPAPRSTRFRCNAGRLAPALAVAAVVALLATAWGSGVASASASSPPRAVPRLLGTVHVANEPGVGKVLVTASGRTLYLLSHNRHPVACTGFCASIWPPLTVSGRPVAGSGARQSLLSRKRLADGREQVTYNGWPLYRYAGDSGPHQANGQGIVSFGGRWAAVTAGGHAAP